MKTRLLKRLRRQMKRRVCVGYDEDGFVVVWNRSLFFDTDDLYYQPTYVNSGFEFSSCVWHHKSGSINATRLKDILTDARRDAILVVVGELKKEKKFSEILKTIKKL